MPIIKELGKMSFQFLNLLYEKQEETNLVAKLCGT